MDYQKIYDECRSRMISEGVLKSFLCAMIVGGASAFIVAFITWFFPFNGLWLSLGLLFGLTGAVMPLFYFLLFRPTDKKVAERIDAFGLDERIITMREFQGDSSYMAQRQREDAVAALASAGSGKKIITISAPLAIITAAAVVGAVGLSMTTVTGLSSFGVIASGHSVVQPAPLPVKVQFVVKDHSTGSIDGSAEQEIVMGGTTSVVVATANDGYKFAYWEDADGAIVSFYPSFSANNVYASKNNDDENKIPTVSFTAVFESINAADPDKETNSGDPREDKENDNNNNTDFDPDAPRDEESDDINSGNNPGGSDGGSDANTNQNDNIIDNNVDYREVYESYYEQAKQLLAEGKEIPPELRQILEKYFGGLQ